LARNLNLLWSPLFPGVVQTECYPLKIVVENSGPRAVGELVIQSNGVAVHYAVDVEPGRKQSFLAYPLMPDGMHPLEFSLNTDQENDKFTDRTLMRDILGQNSGEQFLAIADDPANLGDLLYSRDSVKIFYANPKGLPDRGLAYGSETIVLLGPGAERMSDSAVRGLEQFVLAGGKLFIFGGDKPSVADDPRFRKLCPVRDLQLTTLPSASFSIHDLTRLTNDYNAKIDGPISASTGDPVDGAASLAPQNAPSSDLVQAAYKPVGAGSVYFLGISPFGANMVLRQRSSRRVQWDFIIAAMLGPHTNSASRGAPSGPAPAYTSNYPQAGMIAPESPFSVQLPSITTIAVILLVYVILVAPINLLILRKARKSELAWFTAPCVSLAGAGVFFHFASGLYSAPISKMVSSYVIADGLSGQASSVGNAELFFPSGGPHNVGLDNAELIKNGINVNSFYGGVPVDAGTDQFDVFDKQGSLTMPSVNTRNLSFRSIAFRQDLTGPLPKAELHLKDNTLKGTLWNQTQYTLEDAEIRVKNLLFTLGTIKPGETKHLDEIGHVLAQNDPDETQRYGDEYALSKNRFLLDASVPDMAVGPQIETRENTSDNTLFETFGAPN